MARTPRRAEATAADHAQALAGSLGADLGTGPFHADHPALAWRRAGLLAVSGDPGGPGLVPPTPLAAMADGAMAVLRAMLPDAPLPASGAVLLGERARLLGLRRGGTVSSNGSCHLFSCADGHIALNLARYEDRECLPALLLHPEDPTPDELPLLFARHGVADLVARGIELELPIARVGAVRPAGNWFTATMQRRIPRPARRPRVLDLSSLWAGPLAASLMALGGAEVSKLESPRRPDGARQGNAEFFALLNGGKQHLSVDLADLAHMGKLLDWADIVIEGSRPAALRRLGIIAEAFVEGGGLWLSITGHGRAEPHDRRVAFGDDAAVEAGLADAMRSAWGRPLFAGDAIADPMTGLHAAVLAEHCWARGISALVDIALVRTMRWLLSQDGLAGAALPEWQALAEADDAPLYPMRAMPPAPHHSTAGAHLP